MSGAVITNPWLQLRRFTDARIALGRAGVSQPTQPQLAFQLAHAQARDAVHLALDALAVTDALRGLAPVDAATGASPGAAREAGYEAVFDAIRLHSAAPDRHTYLQRPDLGRRLDAASREALLALKASRAGQAIPAASSDPDPDPHLHADANVAQPHTEPDTPHTRPYDVAFIVADGLSPLAIARHAVPFLRCMLPLLQGEGGWRIAPLSVVEQSRVALADEVGELLGAKLSVILIGERPGLSSPDSMGLYLTWMPRPGLTDAQRNCISNIRQSGLSYEDAARKLHGLLGEARRRQVSGVSLKEG